MFVISCKLRNAENISKLNLRNENSFAEYLHVSFNLSEQLERWPVACSYLLKPNKISVVIIV
jgi:hypothetical protein